MAFEDIGKSISLPADADLSASQDCFVKLANSSGVARAALCSTGQDAIGVLQNDPDAANRAAQIAISGICKIKAGAAITAGANVGSDSTGRGITVATGGYIMGKALESAAAANEKIAMLIMRGAAKL